MRFSNFKLKIKLGNMLDASVDVTTGIIFKKTEQKLIRKTGRLWFFADSGRYVSEKQSLLFDRLARAQMEESNIYCQ